MQPSVPILTKSRQISLGRSLQINQTLTEALGIVRSALEAAVAAAGLDHIGEINIVVISHPNDLRLMAVEHLKLLVDKGSNINVLGGVEIDAAKSVHIKDRNKLGRLVRFRLVVRNGCREASAENKLACCRVVGHIVVGVVGDDKVGINVANDLDDLIDRLFIIKNASVLKIIHNVNIAPINGTNAYSKNSMFFLLLEFTS